MGGRGRKGWDYKPTIAIEAWSMNLPMPMIEVKAEQTYRFPLPPATDTVTRGYQIVGTGWDGERRPYYPLFPTDRAWTLVARDGATIGEHPLDRTHNFGMETPTLSWQNGNQRMELYVDGMTHTEWMERYGVEFRVTKNGFVTSKRMSRMLRDYRVSDRLPEGEVRVDYLDLDADGEAIWDGAGLMSRSMLERLKISPHMPADQQERLRQELKHIGRVEFTLVNSAGQHKGHCLVCENLDVDFRLPRDIKKDAVTTDGTAFVGVNFVHPHDDMRLDMQSIAHLHPFFEEGQMLDYLHQEGDLFRQAIESGRQGEAMARLERATFDDLANWPMRNFFARGGQAQWFPGMVKGLIDGHIERLEVSLERGKLRMPINGGRYYVMTSDVAQAAGLNIPLERGQVHLDPNTATAWVHRDDWLAFEGEQGIRNILGGADQDDALWLHGFTDHDGERKVLAWRSPNNIGEYVLLQPTANSQPTVWHTPDGQTELFPAGDSRKLPTRIDCSTGQTEYLGLAQPPAPGELGAGQPYHPDLMKAVNVRTLENAGALGGYCNYTMGYKGTTGEVPPILPDQLENVIDNDVKLGGSNRLVRDKISELALDVLQSGRPIPKFLLSRFGIYPDKDGQIPNGKLFTVGEGENARSVWVDIRVTDGSHWIDKLSGGVQQHTADLTAYRDAQMAAARLPAAVHDSIAGDEAALKAGAKFNATYTRALKEGRQQYSKVVTANPKEDPRGYEAQRQHYNSLVHDYVRGETEAYLDQHPAERHTAILRGAMVSREINTTDPEKVTSDSAFWQRGRVADTSLRALEEVGLLGELHEEVTERGTRMIRYPTPEHATRQATYEPVEIKQVWFNRAIADNPTPPTMKAIDPASQKRHKEAVHAQASRPHEQGGFIGQRLTVGERTFGINATPTLVLEDEAGNVFGVIPRKQADQWVAGEQVIIRNAKGRDGNLNAMVERVPKQEATHDNPSLSA